MEINFFEATENLYKIDKSEATSIWYGLNQIRFFEEASIKAYKKGLIGGSVHPYIGQEAVAIGICRNLNNTDYMTTTYRGRGHALAKGADPFKLFAEMFGRKSGYCKGKGGPMHIASKKLGMLGANGIVAGGIPIAVGGALTAKRKGEGQVAVTFFGDGATNQGVFHEALNLAAVLQLPVIFVCENNLYSEMTPISDSLLNKDLAERGIAYHIHSVVVDGNDPLAVDAVAKEAIERARSGNGPTFIEAKTYRLLGHMFGDSETYRTKEEVQEWWAKEPLKIFKEQCLQYEWLSERELEEVAEQAKEEINASYEQAVLDEEPSLEEVYTDVY
ncbi:thiamine pyrophosphate-dependent dehydrogenase E1 component subunit alpha [Sporosarcina sp. 179-K 3D1 HS]|uniref:thiamine pyrophosphate-dependent dehydrogenase E1 component subunit alpha n=1 Tax=Sporosarcina sp. 179-K 3D1 HS TaxID=3232169 RepID=UPI0039A2AD53